MNHIRTALAATLFLMLASPAAFAQDVTGDAANGERLFNQCSTCHNVTNAEGDVLAGRPNMRTGPNLYAVSGRTIGSIEDFRYSDGLIALGEMDMVWDQANFIAYAQDPTGFIREASGNNRLRGAMAFRARSEQDAADLYAYLRSLAPVGEEAGEAAQEG
jgi:cytochrome c